MADLERCAWKLVDPTEFTVGVTAERCYAIAAIKILRPYRKTDLCLCEDHLNQFVEKWGLHNQVKILCNPKGGLL